MKKMIFTFLVLFIFSISAHAQMCCGAMGEQKGAVSEGQQPPIMGCPKMQSQEMMKGTQQMPMEQPMMGESQQMPMMNCPKMQQMQGKGMMQGGQQMPMMQMCMPMMQHVMGQGMMIERYDADDDGLCSRNADLGLCSGCQNGNKDNRKLYSHDVLVLGDVCGGHGNFDNKGE